MLLPGLPRFADKQIWRERPFSHVLGVTSRHWNQKVKDMTSDTNGASQKYYRDVAGGFHVNKTQRSRFCPRRSAEARRCSRVRT
jgi:hypothetical protein